MNVVLISDSYYNVATNISRFKSNNSIYKYRENYHHENEKSLSDEFVFEDEDLNIRILLKSFYNPKVEIISKDREDGLYSSIDLYDGEVLKQRINLHDSSKISWDDSNSYFYKDFFAFDDRSNTLFSIPSLPSETLNIDYPTGLEVGVYFSPLNLDKIYDPYLVEGELAYRPVLNNKGLWFEEVDDNCLQYRGDNFYRYADSDLIKDFLSYLESVEYKVYELGGKSHEIYTADYLNDLKFKLRLNESLERINGICNLGNGKDLVIKSRANGDREISLIDSYGEKVLSSQNVFDNNSSLDIFLYGGKLFDEGGRTACFIEDLNENSFTWVCPLPVFKEGNYGPNFEGENVYYEIDFDGEIIDKHIVFK